MNMQLSPDNYLTIKQLTQTVGGGLTPRMVRHYHTLGLLGPPRRSPANYRLYTGEDVQRLRWIVALKEQGFHLSHIRQILLQIGGNQADLISQLQGQYQALVEQLAKLRQTAIALEGVLSRDRQCQHPGPLATPIPLDQVNSHPEAFQESLSQLLPQRTGRSEIEADLLTQLTLASGDTSLGYFLRFGPGAVAAAKTALETGAPIVTDIGLVQAALDHPRLDHLGCRRSVLIEDTHIINALEAEQAFWRQQRWQENLQSLEPGAIVVVGYAPSVLLQVCQLSEQGAIHPALVIGMPVGFSHAPAAKRRLAQGITPYLTLEGPWGGGLLGAVTLNTLAAWVIEKPNCHCYLQRG